jgi:uncharacterized protein YjbI with pentapeptide repeats
MLRSHISRTVALAGALSCVAAVASAQAPARPGRTLNFWDLALSTHARDLSTDGFADYACGTNGGLPATVLRDWTEFARCPAERGTGFHEVQFRYDDELEYRTRAASLGQDVPQTFGTRLYVIPVIVSGLFDDDGFLVGLRAVTDPRVPERDRMQAIALRSFLMNRFDPKAWTCVETPLAEREQPIGSLSFKEGCDSQAESAKLRLESNFYRKAGQFAIDPHTNLALEGQFRSDVRFEMFLAQPIADRAARLAALAAPRPETPLAAARRKAMDCAGCDLSGIDLKRQDLRGAKLAGADLRDANLHAANLAGADLTGADLSGAIVNRADLRRARLAGAKLTETELHAAQLDGADLSAADLTKTMLGSARMTRVNLSRAKLTEADLIKATLLDANLKDATIADTWLTDAQLNRADLSGATISRADLSGASLASADLRGTTIEQTDFYAANLRESNLSGAKISTSRLTAANLTNVNRTGATFENVIDAP